MTFVAIVVAFIATCAAIGIASERASDARLAAALAAAIVCVQLVLLMTR
jgi:hypothetical protein